MNLKFYLLVIILIFNSTIVFSRVLQVGCIEIFSNRLMSEGVFVPNFVDKNNDIIFISKIYNHVDKINKKVYLIFEPLSTIKGTVQVFKIDVTFLNNRFISKKEVGCNITWQLKDESNYKIMLISSRKNAFEKKSVSVGTSVIDLNQFVENSIGFYLESNGLIKDLSDEISNYNDYVKKTNMNLSYKKLNDSEINKLIEDRKMLNFINFKKFQKYLNNELEIAIQKEKINKRTLDSIKYFNEVINKKQVTRGNALKDLDEVFPDRNKYKKFE